MKPEYSRRALLFMGSSALLSACSGRLHGYRRRVGFAVVGERVLMHGQVTRRTLAEFDAVMAENPQVTSVVLQQMGHVHDAELVFALGRDVRKRGLATSVQSDSDVSGLAVALLLAGREREMVQGARLALHDWPPEAASYVGDMLGSTAFHEFALQVGATGEIHEITVGEVGQYELLTMPVKVWN